MCKEAPPQACDKHIFCMANASKTACCVTLGGNLGRMRADNLLLDVVGDHVVLLELHGVLRAALGHASERAHILEHLRQRHARLDQPQAARLCMHNSAVKQGPIQGKG